MRTPLPARALSSRARAAAWLLARPGLLAGSGLLATAWVLAAPGLLQAAPSAADSFRVTEVAPGDFVHIGRQLALDAPGHDDIANIGFIVGQKCVAVVDTGGSTRIGRALLAQIRQHTKKPICYVINTHVHVDHVLGNAAFVNGSARFVGHESLSAALERSRSLFLESYSGDLDPPASAAQIVGPQIKVAEGSSLEVDLGRRRLRLQAWPRAHTDCDLTVYDEVTNTLWAADLLFIRRTPAIDGSVKGWLTVLDELVKLPATRVIPGHGEVQQNLPEAVAPERRYFENLIAEVRAGIAGGKPLQEAISTADASNSKDWLLWDATHPHNVARVYQELEWE
ncbi:MAG TPA: quinoprotein relay system zinc metallohydrolase 2 [Steroidobacteraceae bacterium]|nr:quinoprotein relay system zinc metallohydrolase 2 [Steroidobacteraceae bacterium]